MKGVPDTSEVDDGFWFFFTIVIDLAILTVSAGIAVFVIAVELAAWVLAGGLDVVFSMLGFSDDD